MDLRSSLLPCVCRGAVLAAAGMLGLAPSLASAGVEFVTPVGTCNKVASMGNFPLKAQAGPRVIFEVWGDGLSSGATGTLASIRLESLPDVDAQILRTHSGLTNMGRGCRINKASVEVQLDTPAASGERDMVLSFPVRSILGASSTSGLAVRIVPYQQPVWTWGAVAQNPANCLTKDSGQIINDLNSQRIIVVLPAGARLDTSNCALRFTTTVQPAQRPETDVSAAFTYAISGLPNYLALRGASAQAAGSLFIARPEFDGNALAIRGSGVERSNVVTIRTPNGLADALTIVVRPTVLAVPTLNN
jgi:hypothetical protein